MKKKLTSIIMTALLSVAVINCYAEKFTYDLSKSQPVYSDKGGYGYDLTNAPDVKSITSAKLPSGGSVPPFYFSVKVPDGNYRVTVVLGSKKRGADTYVRAENRRLMVENCKTKKGELRTVSFLVNKRSVVINDKQNVKIKPGEVGSLTWDDKLTLEFNGTAPCVQSITIEPDTTAVTLFLCGNSTVVDQAKEPWASWGQMFPRWFTDKVCVANYGESGLTAASFLAQLRLDKILSEIKPGDYVFCEFGHNDEKEKGPGRGAWYHYSVGLKTFVDRVREKGGNIIFCTPTVRRFFENNGTIRNTHGDFPAAMKAVAERENVPCIDLNASTKVLFETMGEEGSKQLLVHYKKGSFAWQDREFADNTHFNPFGAYEVSKLIVMGLKQINSPLVQYLTKDWQDFSPSSPDSPAAFLWPQSIFHDATKPDGN
ncbi:MAG: rhamnogalacturonan acetylesterase [Prevotella sp.]|nr:rhamnogalacturonan acetylesterase [Prevotella sp.]